MIQTSDTFSRIISGAYVLQYRIDIAGHSLGNESIVSLKTTHDMFAEESPSIGNACAGTIELELLAPDFDIPPMQEITLYMRATNGTETSEWVQRGKYLVDSRKRNYIGNNEATTLEIIGYDSMMKAEALFPFGQESDWPKSENAVFQTICSTMGVTGSAVLAGNEIDKKIDGYSCREVLRFLGALNGGNWMIDSAGVLKLVKLGQNMGTANIIPSDLSMDMAMPGITQVTLHKMDGNKFTSGSSGRLLNADSPWATQAAADRVLSAVSGYRYKAFTAVDAVCDPRLEICDDTGYGIAYKIAAELLDGIVAEVSAPAVEEVNHDYPFISGAGGVGGRALAAAKKAGWDYQKLVAEVDDVKAGIEAEVVKYGDMEDANWIYAKTSVFASAAGKRAAFDIWVEGASAGELTSGASIVADALKVEAKTTLLDKMEVNSQGGVQINGGNLVITNGGINAGSAFLTGMYVNDTGIYFGTDEQNVKYTGKTIRYIDEDSKLLVNGSALGTDTQITFSPGGATGRMFQDGGFYYWDLITESYQKVYFNGTHAKTIYTGNSPGSLVVAPNNAPQQIITARTTMNYTQGHTTEGRFLMLDGTMAAQNFAFDMEDIE